MLSLLQRSLTLRQLRMVSILGRTLNLSQCAEQLHTTQPGVSRALAQLETLLQTRLFERTTKRIVPTPAGVAMIQRADRVLTELALAEEQLHDLRGGLTGELRVGVLPVFAADCVATAILRAGEMLPDVRVQVRTRDIGELYESLLDGRIDLMLAHAELTVDLNRVAVEPLYDEFSSILAATGHRLVRRRRIAWADLADARWVLPPPDTPLRPKLDRMLSVHRRPDRPRAPDVQADSAQVALALVRASDMLWAVADRYAGSFERSGGVQRLAAPAELLRGPMCAFRLRRDPAGVPARVFLQSLREAEATSPQPDPPLRPQRPVRPRTDAATPRRPSTSARSR